MSAEGREQPTIPPVAEPVVETTPAPVVDAPDSTTPQAQTEESPKLDESGKEGE